MSAPESTAPEIRRNDTEHRYEAWVDGEPLAFLFYRQEADRIVLLHTDVLPEAEGRGLGRALARGVLEDVRNRGEEVAPLCPSWRATSRATPSMPISSPPPTTG